MRACFFVALAMVFAVLVGGFHYNTEAFEEPSLGVLDGGEGDVVLGLIQQPPDPAPPGPATPPEAEDECARVPDFIDKMIEGNAEDPLHPLYQYSSQYTDSCYDNSCPPPILPPNTFTLRADTPITSRGNHDSVETHVFNAANNVGATLTGLESDKILMLDTMDDRCSFVVDKLKEIGEQDSHIVLNNSYFQNHPAGSAPKNTCVIPIHSSLVSYDDNTCSGLNHHIFGGQWGHVVDKDSIRPSLHLNKKTRNYEPVCEISFKEDAQPSDVSQYLDWVYRHMPENEYWEEQTRWMLDATANREQYLSEQLEKISEQQQTISQLEFDVDVLDYHKGCFVNTHDSYFQDPNVFINDFVDNRTVEPVPGLKDCGISEPVLAEEERVARQGTLAEACYRHGQTGNFISSLPNYDIYTYRDAWTGHLLSHPATEHRGMIPYQAYIQKNASLELTWKHNWDNLGQAEGLTQQDMLQFAADIPGEAWGYLEEDPEAAAALGVDNPYRHVSGQCTYRDEVGKNACEVRFKEECSWKDVLDNNIETESNAVCEWAFDDDGFGNFQCSEYGKLFQPQSGLLAHYNVYNKVRDDAEARFDEFLLSDEKKGVLGFQGGPDTCVYKDAVDGGCHAAFAGMCQEVMEISAGSIPIRLEEGAVTVEDSVAVDKYQSGIGLDTVRLRGLAFDADLEEVLDKNFETGKVTLKDGLVPYKHCDGDQVYEAQGVESANFGEEMGCVVEKPSSTADIALKKRVEEPEEDNELLKIRFECDLADDKMIVKKSLVDELEELGKCENMYTRVSPDDKCVANTMDSDDGNLTIGKTPEGAELVKTLVPVIMSPDKVAIQMGELLPDALYLGGEGSSLEEVEVGVHYKDGAAEPTELRNALAPMELYEYVETSEGGAVSKRLDAYLSKIPGPHVIPVGHVYALDRLKIEQNSENVYLDTDLIYKSDCGADFQCDPATTEPNTNNVCVVKDDQILWCDTGAGMTIDAGNCIAPQTEAVTAISPFRIENSDNTCALEDGWFPYNDKRSDEPQGNTYGVLKIDNNNSIQLVAQHSDAQGGTYVGPINTDFADSTCLECDPRTMLIDKGECKVNLTTGFYKYSNSQFCLVNKDDVDNGTGACEAAGGGAV